MVGSFKHLSNQYNLPIRFLQIFPGQIYFGKEIKQADGEPNLFNILIDAYNIKHLILRLFNRIQNSQNYLPVHDRRRWERESCLETTEDEYMGKPG